MSVGGNMKPKVAFVCVHNSCRSQMAEAVAKVLGKDIFIAFSAGTEVAPQINQTAVKLIEEKYHVNMNKDQYSKTINSIPSVDIVVTMGCNVDCPHLPSKHREDWGLDDPSGKEYSEFEKTLNTIELKMLDLIDRINNNEIDLGI